MTESLNTSGANKSKKKGREKKETDKDPFVVLKRLEHLSCPSYLVTAQKPHCLGSINILVARSI